MLANMAAFVRPDTTLGTRGLSLLMSRYTSATILKIAAEGRFGQVAMPGLPCFHAMYPPTGTKMAEKNKSTQVRTINSSDGGGLLAGGVAADISRVIVFSEPRIKVEVFLATALGAS